jgi:hypothetical protein
MQRGMVMGAIRERSMDILVPTQVNTVAAGIETRGWP